MKINLENFTIDELVSLKDEVSTLIHNYEDGYLYICSVRQFGSVWEEIPRNLYALRELCNEYTGENGIVDVYTNNPNLKYPEMEFYNYGDTMFIKSEYDYREWVKYRKSERLIEDITESVEKWEKRDELPFYNRPTFGPIWTRDELEEEILNFKSTQWDFVPPVSLYSEINE